MRIANITEEGKRADYFVIPAGSMFPLGCAIPNHTVGGRVAGVLMVGSDLWDVFPSRDYGTFVVLVVEGGRT